jgi:predicted MFS family arabinose efflux permease
VKGRRSRKADGVADKPRATRWIAKPDARRLVAADLLTSVGDYALTLALAVWVKELTGSNSAAALLFLTFTLPAFAAPLFGAFVERMRPHVVLASVNAVLAALSASLLLVSGSAWVPLLYVVAFAFGVGGAIAAGARAALVYAVSTKDELAAANGFLQAIGQGARVAAPLLGAVMYAEWGGGTVATLNALALLASAGVLLSIAQQHRMPPDTRTRLWVATREGIVWVARAPRVRRITVALVVALLGIGLGDAFVFGLLEDGLHREPAFLGVLLAAQGAGSIIGAACASRLIRAVGESDIVAAGLVVFGGGLVLLLSSLLGVVLIGMFICGIGWAWTLVASATAFQRDAAADMQARVATVTQTVAIVAQSISITVGAILIAIVSYQVLIVADAVLLFVAGGMLWIWRIERQQASESTLSPAHAHDRPSPSADTLV